LTIILTNVKIISMNEGKEKVIIVRKRIKVFKKKCVFCGNEFEGTERAIYCSDACRRKGDYERHREERLRKRREKYYRQKQAKQ